VERIGDKARYGFLISDIFGILVAAYVLGEYAAALEE
jgi:hypothetical protein